jgi:hypothetical protein
LDHHGTISLKTVAPTFVTAKALRAVKVNEVITFQNKLRSFFVFIAENICQQMDNLCSDICVPTTDNSYVCQCNDGRELLEDKITCVKKTRLIDNEIPQSLNATVDGE